MRVFRKILLVILFVLGINFVVLGEESVSPISNAFNNSLLNLSNTKGFDLQINLSYGKETAGLHLGVTGTWDNESGNCKYDLLQTINMLGQVQETQEEIYTSLLENTDFIRMYKKQGDKWIYEDVESFINILRNLSDSLLSSFTGYSETDKTYIEGVLSSESVEYICKAFGFQMQDIENVDNYYCSIVLDNQSGCIDSIVINNPNNEDDLSITVSILNVNDITSVVIPEEVLNNSKDTNSTIVETEVETEAPSDEWSIVVGDYVFNDSNSIFNEDHTLMFGFASDDENFKNIEIVDNNLHVYSKDNNILITAYFISKHQTLEMQATEDLMNDKDFYSKVGSFDKVQFSKIAKTVFASKYNSLLYKTILHHNDVEYLYTGYFFLVDVSETEMLRIRIEETVLDREESILNDDLVGALLGRMTLMETGLEPEKETEKDSESFSEVTFETVSEP